MRMLEDAIKDEPPVEDALVRLEAFKHAHLDGAVTESQIISNIIAEWAMEREASKAMYEALKKIRANLGDFQDEWSIRETKADETAYEAIKAYERNNYDRSNDA